MPAAIRRSTHHHNHHTAGGAPGANVNDTPPESFGGDGSPLANGGVQKRAATDDDGDDDAEGYDFSFGNYLPRNTTPAHNATAVLAVDAARDRGWQRETRIAAVGQRRHGQHCYDEQQREQHQQS